jgi:hypothetical protein
MFVYYSIFERITSIKQDFLDKENVTEADCLGGVSPPSPKGRAKENRSKKNTRMKKIIIPILLAVFAAAFLLMPIEQPLAHAFQTPDPPLGPRTDISWNEGYPGPDYYCQCDHTDWGYNDDCCAGISMVGVYDDYLGQLGSYEYNQVSWCYDANLGINVNGNNMPTYDFYNVPYCAFCEYAIGFVNTYYPYVYNYYQNINAGSTNNYGEWTIRSYVPGPDISELWALPYDATFISGDSTCYFQNTYNSNDIVFLAAFPAYPLLTASSGPPTYFQTQIPSSAP